MAGAPKSTLIILLLSLMLLGAAASPLPLLNSSLPDLAAVVADFHRYYLILEISQCGSANF